MARNNTPNMVRVAVTELPQLLSQNTNMFGGKAKFHYAILVADRSEARRRPGRRPAASWNLAYHVLSSSLAAS